MRARVRFAGTTAGAFSRKLEQKKIREPPI